MSSVRLGVVVAVYVQTIRKRQRGTCRIRAATGDGSAAPNLAFDLTNEYERTPRTRTETEIRAFLDRVSEVQVLPGAPI